jgi:hypothetical protein
MLVIPILLALFVFLSPQFNKYSYNIKIITYCFTVLIGEIILLLTSYFQSKNNNGNHKEDIPVTTNNYKIIFSIISSSIVTVSILLLASFEGVTIYKVLSFSFVSICGLYFLFVEANIINIIVCNFFVNI